MEVDKLFEGLKITFEQLPTSKCVMNNGQLAGVPKNPRQWSKEDFENLKASLLETPELFIMRPCICVPHEGKFVVIGGNMRLSASKDLKLKTVPCAIVSEDTTVQKKKEIAAKDNGSFGNWDYDLLANEWSDLPLTTWGVPAWDTSSEEVSVEPEATEDDFDEDTDHIEVRCKRGDIWVLGDHRLMCGDSIELAEVQRLMGGGIG